MSQLLEKLEAAMDERARVIEGSGFLGWLTYRMPDGSMHYTTAGSQPLDEPHWVVDGKEAVGYASAQIVHDEKREWRRVARDRQLLKLHRPHEMRRTANPPMVRCSECGDISEAPVAWPCATVRLLAEDYEIEAESHD